MLLPFLLKIVSTPTLRMTPDLVLLSEKIYFSILYQFIVNIS